MKKLRKNLPVILMGFAFLLGIGLIAYPSVANWWNSFHASRAIADYDYMVSALSDEDYEQMLEAAHLYNEKLLQQPNRWSPSKEFHQEYVETLDVNGNGIMASLNIPKINVKLPVYHSVEESVLQVASGHMEGSSLPVGGIGTHSAISGHTGLPSARLLTDLDQMEVGDIFMVNVLNEKLTYEIDNIIVVEPEEMDQLNIDPDKDQVTLVTCTPYGINSHRLLITGHRIENLPEEVMETITEQTNSIDLKLILLGVGAAAVVVMLLILLFKNRKKDKNKKNKTE